MKQIAFYVDATKCINCKTCEIACKDVNNAALGVRIRKVRTFEGGEFPNVFVYNISMSCNHCEDPVCVKSCPARAYTKRPEDGVVLQDTAACIGCRNCTWVCPYGAPQYDPGAGRVRKCNMCVGLVAKGEDPVCVTACPMRAIEVGSLEEIARRAGVTISLRDLPLPGLTLPSCRYKTKREASGG
jgi:anaerobic dimethyl sulfoxide reductase subunit B (iron-sulfur subunit)